MNSAFTTRPRDLIRESPESYIDETALAAAEHAMAAYFARVPYTLSVMRAGFQGGTVLESGPAQVAIAWSHEVIVISPRGSDQTADWRGNFLSIFRRQWRPTLPKGCRLGIGFRSQVDRIAPLVVEKLLALRELFPRAELVIGGHSLGAALVPPLVAYLDLQGLPVRVAYMLEPPRPGNRRFAEWYNDAFSDFSTPTYMVVNVMRGQTDLVTRVPLRRHGARHVGQRVIHADGRVLFGEDAWQLHRAANPVGYVKAWRVITRTVYSVRAHLGKQLLKTLRGRVEG